MAKVVGHDESAVLRVTCPHCASIVEYTGAEILTSKEVWEDDPGSDYGGKGYVRQKPCKPYLPCPNTKCKLPIPVPHRICI